jgi:hypothetical protein
MTPSARSSSRANPARPSSSSLPSRTSGRPADLFRPVRGRTNGIDDWVSLEVSPTLAYDTPGTIVEVERLRARAERPNLFVKIATDLQRAAAGSFVKDWNEMLASIALKISGYKAAG